MYTTFKIKIILISFKNFLIYSLPLHMKGHDLQICHYAYQHVVTNRCQ